MIHYNVHNYRPWRMPSVWLRVLPAVLAVALLIGVPCLAIQPAPRAVADNAGQSLSQTSPLECVYAFPTAAKGYQISLADFVQDSAEDSTRAHNYPNPFDPRVESTTIVFHRANGRPVRLTIYDLFGHLVYDEKNLDADDLVWDGRNGRGELVAEGGYICVLRIDDKMVSKHLMAVIK